MPETLPQALRHAAEKFGHRGVRIYDRGGRKGTRHGFAELFELASAAAKRWASLGVEPRDRVVVCLPTSWEWMEGWFGAILRGAWPVAAPAPGAMGSSEAQIRRVAETAERIGAKRVLCSAGFRDQLVKLGLNHVLDAVVTPEEFGKTSPATGVGFPETAPDDVAFLQLTSGSTGSPRAVMIPQRGVLHNNDAINHSIGAPHGASAETFLESVVAWLPLYHDMGLVGCLWYGIRSGYEIDLLEPRTFLARPGMWLNKFSRNGLCMAPAPNFAYQLCVERLRDADLGDIDLSGWRAAMTGAEMVQPETTSAFCETFAPTGFRPESFRPCYGLAEGTLAVTIDTRGEGVRTLPVPESAEGAGQSDVVSTGGAIRDTEVRVAAPDGSALPDGRIGEVRVKGPGVFLGYYNDAEATAEGLEDGWLRTGDLGFLADGELYLTGRVKDVLIIRGTNVMPHELERLADGVTGGGGTQRSGAFSVPRGVEGEQPVVVIESGERDAATLAAQEQEIRSRIGRYLGLPLADLVFVRRGRIPKTTSGKVRRRELAELYRDGRLERLSVGG
jgi:fatty-acyl-CoA synthase